MAGDDSTLTVEIVLDDGSVRQGFIRVENQAKSSFQRIGEVAAGVFAGAQMKAAFDHITESVKEFFGDAINQAREAEKSLQAMNVALGASGRYSAAASQQFQELADKLQATTTVSDDQVLALEKLAITYTKTNAQAMKLTETSVNLAAVTGQDANSALVQLSGTLSGHAGRLERLYPALKNFSEEQLKAGAAVDYFNSRFGGAAAAQVNTFDGRMTQLSHNFEDFEKAVGKIVTSSPVVVAIINDLSKMFSELAKSIRTFSEGKDLMKGPIEGMLAFGHAVVMYGMAPLEVLYNFTRTVVDGIKTTMQMVVDGLVERVNNVVQFIAPNSSLAKNLALLKETTGEVLNDMAKDTVSSFQTILTDFKASGWVDGVLTHFDRVAEGAVKLKTAFADLAVGGADELKLSVLSMADVFTQVFGSDKEHSAHTEIVKFANSMDSGLKGTGVRAVQALAAGTSAGFAAIGKALVKGGDLFAAFGGAMLNALGQALMTEGAARVLQGVARLAASYGTDPTGWDLVGIGSAMGVAGGAMMALGSGGSSGGAAIPSTGGGASSAVPSTIGGFADEATTPGAAMKLDNQGGVVVNIHGDVLDSNETGLRIVDLVNDAFKNQGARITAQ